MRRLLLLPLLCGACAPAEAPRPRNVVLICIDTLRADHLGCYGYAERATSPAMDALAARSILFEDVSATAGWTKPSVPSFLTSSWPVQHGVYEGNARVAEGDASDALPAEATTVAEVFHAAGYRTGAFVRNAQLRAGLGFEQGFDLYRDQAGDAREIRWQGLDWIDESPDAPFFLYLHVLDAHWPYDVPDEEVGRFTTPEAVAEFRNQDTGALRDAVNRGTREFGPEEIASWIDLYDGSIHYVDDQIGRLLAGLRARGLAEDTVVCIVSDHGEEFMEHGKLGHGHGLWENLLDVPWILHVPGTDAARVARPVTLVDLAPTLCAAAGVPSSSDFLGANRLDPNAPDTPLFAEHKEPGAYHQSLREGASKWVRRFEPADEAAQAAASAVLPEVGAALELELTVEGEAPWHAHGAEPWEGNERGFLELKGRIAGADDGGFTLTSGARVVPGPDCELYGEVPLGGYAGVWPPTSTSVKVRGVVEGGRLVAHRVKVYADDDPQGDVLRGVVEAVDGAAGVATVSGLRVGFDAETRWRGARRDEALTRDDLFRAVQGALSKQPGVHAGSEYDLAADPAEQRPLGQGALDARAAERLDVLGARLLERAPFRPGARQALDEQAVKDLRAIGY